MKVDLSALDCIKQHAKVMYENLKNDESKDVIVHFVGDLNTGYTNAISAKLEQLIESKISDKQARKRFYSVYIEAIQNIQIHGRTDEHDRVPGGVTIYTDGEKLCGIFLNIIEKNEGQKLLKRYDGINNLDRDELKEVYLKQMMNGEMSKKGGAGLGIITIVLRSQNPSLAKVINTEGDYDIFESNLCIDYRSE